MQLHHADDADAFVELAPQHADHRLRWTLVVVATCGYLAWLILSNRTELDRAVLRFQGTKSRWLIAAILLEVLSQSFNVTVQHRLLRRAGSDTGILATARLVLAQGAVGIAVPGGPAIAAAFSYGQIRRRGLTSTVALWVVAAFNVVGLLAVVTFGAVTATGTSWLSLAAVCLLLAVLVVLVTMARSPQRLRQPMGRAMAFADRFRRHRRPETIEARVDVRLGAFTRVRIGWRDWGFLAVFGLAAVAADCAVWICASHAVIAPPRRCLSSGLAGAVAQRCANFHYPTTPALLVAYTAGQGAQAIPLVPGGIGLVESVMTASLTATKVRAISALSAVLLYRIISFWSLLVIGGSLWLHLRRQRTQHELPQTS